MKISFLGLFIYFSCFGDIFVFSDFDLTLATDRDGGVWNTNMVIFPIDSHASILSPIIIPYEQFSYLHNYLSPDCRTKMATSTEHTSYSFYFDGKKFSLDPKKYCYNQNSFPFHQSDGRANHLLIDLQKSIERHPHNWQGPFYDIFVMALNNPLVSPTVGIITARQHSRNDWKDFFHYLRDLKYVNFVPNSKNIHNVSNPEYDYLAVGKPHWNSSPERKANLMKELIESNFNKPIAYSNPLSEFMSQGKKHIFIFADDHQGNVQKAHELFSHLSTQNEVNFDFVIYNAGTISEIERSGYPSFYQINSPSRITVLDYHWVLQSLQFSCSSLF